MLRKLLCVVLCACALAVASLGIPSAAQAEHPGDRVFRVLDYLDNGDFCRIHGRYREAIVWYTRAIELDQFLALDGYEQRSYCRQAIGDTAGARRDMETWLRLSR